MEESFSIFFLFAPFRAIEESLLGMHISFAPFLRTVEGKNHPGVCQGYGNSAKRKSLTPCPETPRGLSRSNVW
jgi:hypothetical protein